jgi:crossover junction endodeoxyribonuclease RuvC
MMMAHVLASILALDLGLQTGWALLHDGRIESGVEHFAVRGGESPGMRFVYFNRWLHRITAPLLEAAADGIPTVIAYEAAHHRGRAATELGYGWATRVQEFAARFELNHVPVHSGQLKRWVTEGNGRASKDEMLAAVRRRGWLPPGKLPQEVSDDETDALGLLHFVETEIVGKSLRRGKGTA